MKILLFPLLLAIAVSAQSPSGPCGSSPTVAAGPSLSGKVLPVAAKAVDAGGVAAQIRLRRPQPASSCRCGTVVAGLLTARSNSQEIPILTGIAGSFRFDHVLLQETWRFSSGSVSGIEVGVGRANLGTDVVPPFPLKSAAAADNFIYRRPNPPQLSGAYTLVLNFKASAPLGDGYASNFTAGALTWEVCGYNAQ